MGKILFLDVDGTLVDYNNNLPESAVEAIHRARLNGHQVYICTGRSRAEIYDELINIGLDGIIGGNGCYVEVHDNIILHQTITQQQCKLVVDWLHKRGLEFYLESNNGLFASELFEEKALLVCRKYAKRIALNNSNQITVRSVFPHMIFDGNLYRDDVNKISFILSSYQDYLDAQRTFPDLHAGTWGGKGNEALFGDLGVKDINKAIAIEKLLQHLHADVENTIAFGDAKVDIPMLEYCEFGVAMGNGGLEIKAIADYVTSDVEEDGLWNAFKYLKLI